MAYSKGTSSASILEKTCIMYIDVVLENLEERFPDTELMAAFTILALRPLSVVSDVPAWGNDMLETLTDQYDKPKGEKEFKISKSKAKINPQETRDEWRRLKQTVLQQLYPRDNMKELLALITKFHKEEFPNMMKLAYYAITHATHTSDCERSFSNQNNITIAQRNRLCPENIDKIMRIQI